MVLLKSAPAQWKSSKILFCYANNQMFSIFFLCRWNKIVLYVNIFLHLRLQERGFRKKQIDYCFLCILSATFIPVQWWWCHILWVFWRHWLTVQFVVALSVCIGVCDADVRASASFVPPKYFYCILPVIADNNVIESVSNLAPAKRTEDVIAERLSMFQKHSKRIWSMTCSHSEQRPRKL